MRGLLQALMASYRLERDEVDKLLLSINSNIDIRRYSNRETKGGRNDGIYYKGKYICAIPRKHMYKFPNEDYKGGITGQVTHRSIENLADVLVSNGVIHPHDKKIMLNY